MITQAISTHSLEKKVVLLGAPCCGKSCLLSAMARSSDVLRRSAIEKPTLKHSILTSGIPTSETSHSASYERNFSMIYSETYDIWKRSLEVSETSPTPGMSLHDQAQSATFSIWDTSGNMFLSLSNNSRAEILSSCWAVLLCYDVTDLSSFHTATKRYFDDVCGPESALREKPEVVLLVGCKMDNFRSRQVSIHQAEEFATTHGIFFIETSSKTQTNIDLTLRILTSHSIDGDRLRLRLSSASAIFKPSTSAVGAYLQERLPLPSDYGWGMRSGARSNHIALSSIEAQAYLGSVPPLNSSMRNNRPSYNESNMNYNDSDSEKKMQSSESGLEDNRDKSAVASMTAAPDLYNVSTKYESPVLALRKGAEKLSERYVELKDKLELSRRNTNAQSVTYGGGRNLNSAHNKSKGTCSRSNRDSNQVTIPSENVTNEDYACKPGTAHPAKVKEWETNQGKLVPVVETKILRRSRHQEPQQLVRDDGFGDSNSASAFSERDSMRTVRKPLSSAIAFHFDDNIVEHPPIKNLKDSQQSDGEQAHRKPPLSSEFSEYRPILYLDINLGDGRSGRIEVRKGDDPYYLAQLFVKTFCLEPSWITKLASLVRTRMTEYTEANVKNDIDNDNDGTSNRSSNQNLKPKQSIHGDDGSHNSLKPLSQNPSASRYYNVGNKQQTTVPVPFQFTSDKRQNHRRSDEDTILKLNIQISAGKSGTIVVKEGDDPLLLAKNFVTTFRLNKSMISKISEKIEMALDRLDEELKDDIGSDDDEIDGKRSPNNDSKTSFKDAVSLLNRTALHEYAERRKHDKIDQDLKSQPPILFNLDVDIGTERPVRLVVYKDCNASQLAKDFATKHGLSDVLKNKLEVLIVKNVAACKDRVDGTVK